MSKNLKVEFYHPNARQTIVGEIVAYGRDAAGKRLCRVKYKDEGFDVPAAELQLYKPSKELLRALQIRDQINLTTSQTRNVQRIANQPLPKQKAAKFDKLFEDGKKKLDALAKELDTLFEKKLSAAEIELLTAI